MGLDRPPGKFSAARLAFNPKGMPFGRYFDLNDSMPPVEQLLVPDALAESRAASKREQILLRPEAAVAVRSRLMVAD